MCFKYFFQKKYKNYTPISTNENELTEPQSLKYNVFRCCYMTENTTIHTKDVISIKINKDHIVVGPNSIKFEYIACFNYNNKRILDIYTFCAVSGSHLDPGDNMTIVRVQLESNKSVCNLLKNIFKRINIYKARDNYDKDVHTFDWYRKMNCSRKNFLLE